jgi:prevent-host-death family protein
MYTMRYPEIVRVTITKLRQDLFNLVDRTLEGEPLEFTHRGGIFKIMPETKQSKLSKLSAQPVVAPNVDVASTNLLKEMESEWEKDWSEL